MIKVENLEVFNVKGAIRGMRNPLNSWDKSDSTDTEIGANDLSLMRRLYKAGTSHRKYLRQIFVCMDITAPLYWWKEFDTYKVGTVSNSCSTMHKIHAKEFTLDDFSCEHLTDIYRVLMEKIIVQLNGARKEFISSKNKHDWWQMIQLLPSSYNQKRTITMSLETVVAIIEQRSHHKLDEWHQLIDALKAGTFIEDIINVR